MLRFARVVLAPAEMSAPTMELSAIIALVIDPSGAESEEVAVIVPAVSVPDTSASPCTESVRAGVELLIPRRAVLVAKVSAVEVPRRPKDEKSNWPPVSPAKILNASMSADADMSIFTMSPLRIIALVMSPVPICAVTGYCVHAAAY